MVEGALFSSLKTLQLSTLVPKSSLLLLFILQKVVVSTLFAWVWKWGPTFFGLVGLSIWTFFLLLENPTFCQNSLKRFKMAFWALNYDIQFVKNEILVRVLFFWTKTTLLANDVQFVGMFDLKWIFLKNWYFDKLTIQETLIQAYLESHEVGRYFKMIMPNCKSFVLLKKSCTTYN